MPTYSFKREDGDLVERKLTFQQFQQCRSGESQLSDDDGSLLVPVLSPGTKLKTVFTDGQISGGWATKTYKEKDYRKQRFQSMGRRQRDHVKVNNLIPNFQGQEASSWADVRDEVRTKVGVESAKTYDALVNQEKKVKL